MDAQVDLTEWINQDYLNQDTIESIVTQIEEFSEISLKEFFKEKILEEVTLCLRNNNG